MAAYEDGTWHVAAALAGMGRDPNTFVYYVQRYIIPQEGRRYTGDVATRTWDSEAAAQAAADAANDGRREFNIRGTYL